jgi:branched-chain amino acid transport system substrate-binding protein
VRKIDEFTEKDSRAEMGADVFLYKEYKEVKVMKKLLFVTVTVISLVALSLGGVGSATAAEPIRIGFLGPYVGVFSFFGSNMRDGFKLYLEEIGYKAAGRQIIFVDEDTEGKPEVGLTKTRKLIEQDQVQILAGIISSGVAYAVRDYVISRKVPLVICNAGAQQLTQAQRSPYIFRVSFANGQQDRAGGWYAAAKMGVKKYLMIGEDYAAGHEKANGFKETFKYMGGEIVNEIYTPLGTNDYAPYLAKLADYVGKVDRLWTFFPGSDGIRFITQYDEYGLKEKIPIFGEGGTTDDSSLASEKDAALGVMGYMDWSTGLDTTENNRFVKAYREKYKDQNPGIASQSGYVGAEVIVKAIEAVGGKVENQEAFLKALKSVKFEAPRGPFSFDEDQNVIENVYMLRVGKKEGRYTNLVVGTVPDVTQLWMPKK